MLCYIESFILHFIQNVHSDESVGFVLFCVFFGHLFPVFIALENMHLLVKLLIFLQSLKKKKKVLWL